MAKVVIQVVGKQVGTIWCLRYRMGTELIFSAIILKKNVSQMNLWFIKFSMPAIFLQQSWKRKINIQRIVLL